MPPLSIEKPKLPKTLAYPLKTSLLEMWLAKIDLRAEPNLTYWTPQRLGSILEAHYWFPSPTVSYTRVYIRAGSLPHDEVRVARELLEERALPAFIEWLSKLEQLSENSPTRGTQPWFEARIQSGTLLISSQPQISTPPPAA